MRDRSAALAVAVNARLAGDYTAAQHALETLLAADPLNADGWVQLGLVYAASGDAPRAQSAFLRALEIAPDYDDAKLGLARLAFRSGDVDRAEEWLNGVSTARAHDPEVADFQQSLTAARMIQSQWRFDLANAYSSLSGDLAPWRETSVAISHRDGDRTVGAGIELANRFGRTDLFGELRLTQAAQGGTWSVAIGGAAQPDFKPTMSVRLEFASREDNDWSLDGSIGTARYAVGQVDRLGLRVGWRIGEGMRVRAQGIVVRDETNRTRNGYSVDAAWRLNDSLELTSGWADAPESSEGVTIDVRSAALGIAADVAPGFRLRVGTMREARDAFDRLEFSISIARTF